MGRCNGPQPALARACDQQGQIRVLCPVPRASRLAGWGALVLLGMRTTVVLGQVGVGEANARTCLGWFERELGEQSPKPTPAAMPNNRNIPYIPPRGTLRDFRGFFRGARS